MSALIKTIGTIFDPVLNFFQQVWDYLVSFFAFLWDLIEGLYFGFNTVISYSWNTIIGILDIPFVSNLSSTIGYISSYLGVSIFSLFNSLLLISIFLVGLRFVWSLIPFFKK